MHDDGIAYTCVKFGKWVKYVSWIHMVCTFAMRSSDKWCQLDIDIGSCAKHLNYVGFVIYLHNILEINLQNN